MVKMAWGHKSNPNHQRNPRDNNSIKESIYENSFNKFDI